MDNSRILVISDTQAPFHHPDFFPFIKYLSKKLNPTRVIHIGDEVDYSFLSFHGTHVDGISPSVEMQLSQDFVSELASIFPVMDLIESNHGALPYRKAKAHGIPRALMREYREVLGAPQGWKWHPRLDVTLRTGKKCRFAHGLSGNASLSALDLGMCVVQGHYHSKFELIHKGHLWGMTVGCLIDDTHEVFSYNKTQSKRPQLGCGVIVDGRPELIPMVLNELGRWVGFI